MPVKNSQYPVLWYYPNVVCYIRIILLVLSVCLFAKNLIFYSLIVYATSAILDAFDGFLARAIKQISNFGAILDYNIDRVNTLVLFGFLIAVKPLLLGVWILILSVDVFSHLCRLHLVNILSASHHKKIPSQFRLLNSYYKSQIILFLACLFYDGFLVGMIGYFSDRPLFIYSLLMVFCLPGFLFKVIIHIQQTLETLLQSRG